MASSPYRVLVFPCGSEIGLEVAESLRYNKHFELIGVNSQSDHGRFIFENYFEIKHSIHDELPCVSALQQIVKDERINLIYPTMDLVLSILKKHESTFGVPVVTSPLETTAICLSKAATYTKFSGIIRTPNVYSTLTDISSYPVFIKPDIGYGSRGAQRVNNEEELTLILKTYPTKQFVISEYLPGKEVTVDCISDQNGQLLYAGARERGRISNGISVSSSSNALLSKEMRPIAETINNALSFQGAWFFQLKQNTLGDWTLLEIACRLAGSSAVHRIQGINFAELSCYIALKKAIEILPQQFVVQLDRALSRRTKLSIEFNHVYVDLDDTLILSNKVNCELIAFLFACRNKNKTIHLITKHAYDLDHTLNTFGLAGIFHSIFHLRKEEKKSTYITEKSAIFIDDSFAERKDIFVNNGIPVFSIDNFPDFLF